MLVKVAVINLMGLYLNEVVVKMFAQVPMEFLLWAYSYVDLILLSASLQYTVYDSVNVSSESITVSHKVHHRTWRFHITFKIFNHIVVL